jgi:hypothetical protein
MMVTVTYPDEGPITYSSEQDRRLVEEVRRACGSNVREICTMARAFIRSEMDPIHATGEPFVFGGEVPDPYANVDLLEALRVTGRDARACEVTLEVDGSTEATLAVLRNSIAWLRFWSVRSPSAEGRETSARNLERMEQKLSELRAKAFQRGNVEMIEGLSDMENDDG